MANNKKGGGDTWQPPNELNPNPPSRSLPRQHPGTGRRDDNWGGGRLKNLDGMREDTRRDDYDRSAHRDEKLPY